jgi:hypothetical protein
MHIDAGGKSVQVGRGEPRLKDYVRSAAEEAAELRFKARLVEKVKLRRRIHAAYPIETQLRILRSGDQAKIAAMNQDIEALEAFAKETAERIRAGEDLRLRDLVWPTVTK